MLHNTDKQLLAMSFIMQYAQAQFSEIQDVQSIVRLRKNRHQFTSRVTSVAFWNSQRINIISYCIVIT